MAVRRNTVLATQRLRLEAIAPGHSERIWAATKASLDELRPWLYWAVHADGASTTAFVASVARAWSAGTDWVFAILLGETVLGTIGLHRYDPTLRSAELGYWLRSDSAGRGYMTEAGTAVVDFAFVRLGLHRIELHAAPANVASVRVAEKLGFRREGLLRDGSRGADGWHDVYVMGLLAHDPRRRDTG